ncbi:hypothetical protein FVE85_9861 [Porphyridium purpureum]|uniref:Uncharacterized protein n=1 Tax=Porphyridium purpureum TaxID=35688 RepID=A0A5J4YHS1_PORPP|nr:hypothetical protein FVE85_9861 [Porphyridium purpureum]|eukprot:POR6701..scf289_17
MRRSRARYFVGSMRSTMAAFAVTSSRARAPAWQYGSPDHLCSASARGTASVDLAATPKRSVMWSVLQCRGRCGASARSTSVRLSGRDSEKSQDEDSDSYADTGAPDSADVTGADAATPKSAATPARLRAGLILGLWGAALLQNISFAVGLPSETLLNDPAAQAFLKNLLDPSAVNPIFWAVFNLLGVWPVITGAMVGPGRHRQPRAYAATYASSFFMGAYAFAPYLALRKDEFRPDAARNVLLDVDSKPVGLLLLAASLVFLYQGVGFAAYSAEILDVAVYSQWINFVLLFKQSALVHFASVDFVLFWSIFPILQVEDMKLRGLWQSDAVSNWATVISTQLVPVIGPLFYMLNRPPIRAARANQD